LNSLRRSFLVILLATGVVPVFAQFGGGYTFAFLQLPPSARISALGGMNISTYDNDLTLGYQNPAAINETMDGALSVNHAFLRSGIMHGFAGWGKQLSKINATMQAGVLYRTYGNFEGNDPGGNRTGSFSANEMALHAGIGYGNGKLRYGANMKLLYSQLESYSSLGVSADLGLMYLDTARLFTAGLVMRNIGTQFKPYVADNYEELPFGIDFGVSKRLRHLPLQLSITLHDLQKFDIRYDDPNAVQETNIFSTDTITEEKNYTVDKIAQHLIIGGEFYFGKNVMARIGYDHMTRREMSVETRRGLTGFALGFGMAIKKYRVEYGHEFYSLAGGSHHITIAMNLNTLTRH